MPLPYQFLSFTLRNLKISSELTLGFVRILALEKR